MRGHRGRAREAGRAADHEHVAGAELGRLRRAARHVARARRGRSGRSRARRARRTGSRCRSPRPRRRAPCRGGSTGPASRGGTWPWRRRGPPAPATSPVDASTPDGTSAATTGAAGRVDRLDHAGRRLARRAGGAGAEQRVDDRVRAARAGSASNGSGGSPGSRSSCSAASPWSVSGGQTASTSTSRPAWRSSARGHQAVAAVVALAADDRDPARRRAAGDHAGEPLPRALHQVERRHALALLDRPARRSRASAPPSGSGSSQPAAHVRTATAAAMPCVWVSDTLTLAPSSAARAPRRAGQPHRGRLVTAAEHLDVAPAPLAQLERLRHRLLGAEARRQVHHRPRARGRVGPLAVGEQPLRQPAGAARARARGGRSRGGRCRPSRRRL